mmetsp:Transcript_14168/g.28006  ORF Transcript_14168/g.28006 Transcript_14168/m.28006 type:complete len:273 (-) Transcript_14168:426-1244(-)
MLRIDDSLKVCRVRLLGRLYQDPVAPPLLVRRHLGCAARLGVELGGALAVLDVQMIDQRGSRSLPRARPWPRPPVPSPRARYGSEATRLLVVLEGCVRNHLLAALAGVHAQKAPHALCHLLDRQVPNARLHVAAAHGALCHLLHAHLADGVARLALVDGSHHDVHAHGALEGSKQALLQLVGLLGCLALLPGRISICISRIRCRHIHRLGGALVGLDHLPQIVRDVHHLEPTIPQHALPSPRKVARVPLPQRNPHLCPALARLEARDDEGEV